MHRTIDPPTDRFKSYAQRKVWVNRGKEFFEIVSLSHASQTHMKLNRRKEFFEIVSLSQATSGVSITK
jgi:hypothetical protein